jgi:hypothetical protein
MFSTKYQFWLLETSFEPEAVMSAKVRCAIELTIANFKLTACSVRVASIWCHEDQER